MRVRDATCRVLVVFIVVASVVPAGAIASTTAAPTITDVSFGGPAVVDYNGSVQRFLWSDSNHTATVDVSTPQAERGSDVSVCMAPGNASTAAVTNSSGAVCRDATLDSNSSSIELASTGWPFNDTGEQQVTVTLLNDSVVLDQKTIDVVVVAKDGDLDDDGLSNRGEVKAGTNMTESDTDGDSLSDGVEVKKYGTSPLREDTDDDGARDAREVSVGTNPTEPDSDSDGITDGEELKKGMDPLSADSDDDGLADQHELRIGTDPTSADTDDDGLDDFNELENGTDPTLPDTDGDGLTDEAELERGTDPTDWDSDGDFLSDGHEVRLGTNPSGSLSPFGYVLAIGVLAMFGVRHAVPRVDVDEVRARLDWLDANGNATLGDDADGSSAARTTATPDPVHDVPRPGATPDSSTPPVMTDEERVKQLLSKHDGRLQQTTIIDETDWSKSKVSRLLSRMADDGEIRKISVGRENLIAFPEDAPEDSTSPPR